MGIIHGHLLFELYFKDIIIEPVHEISKNVVF